MCAAKKNSDYARVMDLQKGSRTAFREIFNSYQAKLLDYAISIVKTERIGKDIVQETFIRLWTNRRKLDPNQSLSGYLHTIARNLALNHLKRAANDKEIKKKIWQNIQESQNRTQTSENIIAQESDYLIQEAIERMPPKRKLIFQLSRQKGMTHQEIGLELGISKNTVKNQMVSALKDIRYYLKVHTDIAFGWVMLVIILSM